MFTSRAYEPGSGSGLGFRDRCLPQLAGGCPFGRILDSYINCVRAVGTGAQPCTALPHGSDTHAWRTSAAALRWVAAVNLGLCCSAD